MGIRGWERAGKKKWRHYVKDVVARLITALEPDYVVLGGGNVHKLKKMPPGCRVGAERECVPRRVSLVGGSWREGVTEAVELALPVSSSLVTNTALHKASIATPMPCTRPTDRKETSLFPGLRMHPAVVLFNR